MNYLLPSLFSFDDGYMFNPLSNYSGICPNIDTYEIKDRFIVKMEIPGISKDDIDINLKENRLTISGEKKLKDEDVEAYHRSEIKYGKFKREFTLSSIDTDKIEAKHDNGVLILTLSKKKDSVKNIPVR